MMNIAIGDAALFAPGPDAPAADKSISVHLRHPRVSAF